MRSKFKIREPYRISEDLVKVLPPYFSTSQTLNYNVILRTHL